MTCEHKDIANMDFTRGGWPDYPAEQHVNRCCRKCWQHWAGPVGAVNEYTKAEWDALLDATWWIEKPINVDTSPEHAKKSPEFEHVRPEDTHADKT